MPKMHRIAQYLKKQGKSSSFFKNIPSSDLKLTVVIPAYKERNIADTIESLFACDPTDFDVEIIVFVNGFVTDSTDVVNVNQQCIHQLEILSEKYSSDSRRLLFYVDLEIEDKKGGVGLARKTLMDEALYRYLMREQEAGIIVNLDADCTVSKNYLNQIIEFFNAHPKLQACSINYEHRSGHSENKQAIIDYESHLRYFIGMQKLIALPFAYQTIGSAMAVTADAYAAVGGMNTRKAGEDFYFVHKFVKNNSCGNLNTTTVYPTDRVSDRVPFGTGRAILETQNGKSLKTYNPKSFEVLEVFLDQLPNYYDGFTSEYESQLNEGLVKYLRTINFAEKLIEIRKHTKDFSAFKKRFFQFFDAFRIMKYLHFMRDHGHADVEIQEALSYYFSRIGLESLNDPEKDLASIRSYDKREVKKEDNLA